MDPVLAQILIAFFAALPPTLMALAAFLRSIDNGRKADTAKEAAEVAKEEATNTAGKVDTAIQKIDDNTAKTETVVKQTNGLSDRHQQRLANVERELADHTELLKEMKEYMRESSHRHVDILNAVHVEVVKALAMQEAKAAQAPAVVVLPPPHTQEAEKRPGV